MAEEKLGTLQYEMEISEVKLKESLKNIDELLKQQDAKWKEALSNVGSGMAAKEKELTKELIDQKNAVVQLDRERAKTTKSTRTKELREEAAQLRQNVKEEKLKIAIETQATGSVARLRAEIALYVFQLSKINDLTPASITKIRQLNQAIAANKNEISAMQPQLNMWGKLASAIKTYVTAYLSVQGVMALGRSIFTQTKDLDSLNFSMQTVIKSQVELAQTQKFLSDVAINYGGDLLTLSERYIKFRAAAVQSNVTASETQKIFESVSKAAGTLGLKTDELSGVYLALEQMLSKGKVTTEELRRQLGERLPGAFGIMANALGVTIPELDKMLKKGEVLSTVALPKFAIALEKAYGIESLKKIDTLAAAQGRMSTEFTGLIKAMEASDEIKNAINSLASFIGFIKDNIGAISALAKAMLVVVAATTTYRLSSALSIPIQRTLILLGRQQTAMLTQLAGAELEVVVAQKAAIAGTTLWTRAWNALKVAFLSNPIGAIATGVALLATALYLFIDSSKEAAKESKSFADNMSAEKAALDSRFNSLQQAKKGSYEYKNTLFEINNLYGKYLPNLLTEKSSIDEVTAARKKANEALTEEMFLREKASRLEAAVADRDKATAEIMNAIIAAAPSISSQQKGKIFNRILDIANLGELDPEKRKALIAKAFKGDLDAIEEYVSKATYALEGYKATVKNINDFFAGVAPTKPIQFDIESIKKAKEEFDDFTKLKSQGVEQLFVGKFVDKDNQTFEQWIRNRIALLSASTESAETNKDAIIALYLALADADKKASKTTSDANKDHVESLQAQLTLLEKMKSAYDKLRAVQSESEATKGVLKEFGGQAKDLGVEINPNLNTENFNAQMELIADAVEKYDLKIAQAIRQKISVEATDQTVTDIKKIFEAINIEIEKFKEKDELRKAIFDITGDTDLAFKLTFDKEPIDDIVQYMQSKVVEMGRAAGFDNTFEGLVANFKNLTPDLQKAIEDVQKYVADKSKNVLLDALKFITEGIPEGVDINFDFSKVIVEMNKSLDKIKRQVTNATTDQALATGAFTKEQIDRIAQLAIDATNEVAKNQVEKLGQTFIKDSLPEQLANDFQDLNDASNESIKSILQALDKMQSQFRSEESIVNLSKAFGLDGINEVLDSLSGTGSLDEFLSKVALLQDEIANADKDAAQVDISGSLVNKEDIAKLNLFALALEKLGISIKVAGREVRNTSLERLAKDAQKLSSEIGGLIDSVEGLAESFGMGLSESGKAALNAIKESATGITSIISSVAILASESISAVEKASVILTIISTVIRVATAINNAIRQSKKEIEDREQAMIDIAYAYNDALRQRNELLEQAKTIFGTDEQAAGTSYINEMAESSDNLKTTLYELSYAMIDVGNKISGWQKFKNFLGVDYVSDKNLQYLTEVWPDLMKDGVLNIERAEAILQNADESLGELSKKRLQDAIGAQKEYNENLLAFDDYLTSIFGNLGSNLMTAITENLDSTKNALDSFVNYAGSILEKLFSDLAYSIYLAPIFAEAQKTVKAIYADAEPDDANQIVQFFKEFTPIVKGGIEGATDFLNVAKESASQAGFDIFTGTEKDQSVTKGIQAVTEDTARRLEGLINSVRENVITQSSDVKRLVDSNNMIQGYAAQSLTELRMVNTNLSTQIGIFNDWTTTAQNTGGKGLKVYVQ